ncbi:MAG: hypothetical protein KJN87_01600 [Desulfofustis sp.]|nr:hypothetical protein [Desulfofustis sp.]
MRFLLCLVIWIVFVGGLYAYTEQRDRGFVTENVVAIVDEKSPVRISIELTPTFSVEDDPFALQTDELKAPFDIRLNGMAVDIANLTITRGQTLFIRDLEVALSDHNEIFIKASPPVAESHLTHGIRLRRLSKDLVLADQTIWSSGGGLVSGTVPFELPVIPEIDHDH